MRERGYIVKRILGHPCANRAGDIPQHWFVFHAAHPELAIQLKSAGFTLHHRNGLRDDNRLENLQPMAPGKHPSGWTIEEMAVIVDAARTAGAISP